MVFDVRPNFVDGREHGTRWTVRPCDHHDWNAATPGSGDLGISRVAAGILGEYDVDAEGREQQQIIIGPERATGSDNGRVRQRIGFGDPVDDTNDVVMLRRAGERIERQATETGENSARHLRQGVDRLFDGRERMPQIARLGLPGRPFERDQRHGGQFAGSNCIGTDDGSKRMGGIDHDADLVLDDVISQSLDPAEAADAERQVGRHGIGRASGERQRRCEPPVACDPPRQRVGFAGAAEQQNPNWLFSAFHGLGLP